MTMDWGRSALEFVRGKRRAMATAPRDGTFIRLHFRPIMDCPRPDVVGQWQDHEEMPAGGSWFDRDGNYITPGPIAWSPEHGGVH
jgi:hypothetical protein